MRAVQSGRQAALDGQPVTACPHPRESLLRTAWLLGYRQGSDPDLINESS
ncbi:hypothetical protein OHV05_15365 [Kitasatospora sp. NBC_00070]